jgi:hypothetical protein
MDPMTWQETTFDLAVPAVTGLNEMGDLFIPSKLMMALSYLPSIKIRWELSTILALSGARGSFLIAEK